MSIKWFVIIIVALVAALFLAYVMAGLGQEQAASPWSGKPAPSGEGAATGTGEQSPQVTQEKQYVNVYFVDIESKQGVSGEKIGCGDTAVPMKWEIEPTKGVLRAALEELIGLGVRDIKARDKTYYNALYQSDLKLESAEVQNGVATVRLSGKLVSGGTCDDPRIVAQLKETVEQFPTVKQSKIFINNQPLETYFSQR